MKVLSITFLLAINMLSFSQNSTYDYRLVYKYEFQTDSTDVNSVKQEDMILLLNDEKSYFYSSLKFALDDLVKNNPNAGLQELLALRKSVPTNRVKSEIEKSTKSSSNIYYEKISGITYRFKEDKLTFNWKVESKEKQIHNFICKKATVNFAGRNYTAWYTTEIPISDGPYKFKGLPGMIIEIYDSKNHHHFTLKSFKKEKGTFPLHNKKIIDVSIAEIKKVRDSRFKNSKFNFVTSPELMRKAKERRKK